MLLAAVVLANPTMTLDVLADRLPAVLETLGKATSQRLECAANLNREVVVMHIDNRPQDEVMAQFAAALDADWKAIDGGYRLVRSPERVKALKESQAAREAKEYAGWMAEVRVEGPFEADRLASRVKGLLQGYRPNDATSLLKANEDGPGYRALLRALQAVGSRALATIPVGSRVVYASRPTPAQRPLNAQGILRQYAAEHQAWVEAAKRQGVRPPRIGGSTVIPPGLVARLAPREAPARALLELSRHGRGPSVAAYLTLVDAQGRVMDKASVSPGTARYDRVVGKIPLALSPDAAAIGGFWVGPEMGRPLPAELRARLSDPVQNEPLRFVAGDLLTKIARRRKVSLVASLCDTMFLLGSIRPKNEPLTEEEYLVRLAYEGFEATQSGEWLVGRVTEPTMRDVQTERGLIGEFAKLPVGESLDEAADWAARLPGFLENGLPMAIRSLVQGADDPTFNSNEPRTLRFYGTLSREQRSAARRGISLGSLTALQRERLQPLLGLIGPLEVEGPRPEDREDDAGDGDILGEPTEAMPQGIPREGLLQVEGSQREVVLARRQGSNFPPMAYSAREFADQMEMSERMKQLGFQSLDTQNLQPADQENLTLRFRLTETVSAKRHLSASRSRGDRGDLNSMPLAFRQEVEKIRERWRKSVGAGTPPP